MSRCSRIARGLSLVGWGSAFAEAASASIRVFNRSICPRLTKVRPSLTGYGPVQGVAGTTRRTASGGPSLVGMHEADHDAGWERCPPCWPSFQLCTDDRKSCLRHVDGSIGVAGPAS
jgi:hypothetical protein